MLHTLLTSLFVIMTVLALWGIAFGLVRPVANGQLGLLHLAAFAQNVDLAGVLQNINAVPDQSVTTQGADLRVPTQLPFLIGQAAASGNTTPSRAQIQSPSLRAMMNLDVEPLVAALVFGSPAEQYVHGDSPIPLVANESINFQMQATGGAATLNYGLVWLSDGVLQPVKGPIYTVRATSAVTLAASTWVNGGLTFSQTLPAGTYQVVGMRARGPNLVAARLVFTGGMFRPGVAAINALGDLDPYYARYGQMGVFGQFDNTTPPTVDCLGVTDTAQTFLFDLMKIK